MLEYYGGDLEDAEKAIDEQYNGCYKSLADFAEEMTDQTTEVPDNLSFYIDYEKMGRDFEYSGTFSLSKPHTMRFMSFGADKALSKYY